MRFFCTALFVSLSSSALAQDLMGFSRSDFGQVVLNQRQSASGDMELELSVGQYNNEAITNYSTNSIFARIGRAVGRLDILTDGGVFPCTAFIVSDSHIVTNYHCVPGIIENEQVKATRIQAVQFVAGYTLEGVEEGTSVYQVNPQPIEADQELDFAVLEVFGNPSRDWGTLQIAANAPNAKDPYWVIGHPMGESQRISREKCRAAEPALSRGVLRHTCDTLPGNSGSPVIDASLQMVIALHHAGSRRNSVNYAIPMARILEKSPTLAALRTQTPDEIEAETARQMEELAGRAATLRAELEAALESAKSSGAQAQGEIEKLGAALNAALAELAAQRANAAGTVTQTSEEREKFLALQEEMAGLQEQLGEMQKLRADRQAAEARLQLEEARKAELAAEASRLQEELANAQSALNDMAQNATLPDGTAPVLPDPLAQQREERLNILKRYDTRRAWQLYVTTNGTVGLESRDMVQAANRIEVLYGYEAIPGKAFEEMLNLSEAQRKVIQNSLNAEGHEVGAADGAFGTKTRLGIRAWNQAHDKISSDYVNAAMLKAIGLRWTLTIPVEFQSSLTARLAGPKSMVALGEDEDIIERLTCLGLRPSIYARWQGHFYVAVQATDPPVQARDHAQKCGGYLVAIGTAAENKFIADLINGERRYFSMGYDQENRTNYKNGPMIGLFQSPNAREPKGGWSWVNGESLRYSNWQSGQPNEYKNRGEDFVQLVSYVNGSKRDMTNTPVQQWADYDGRYSKGYIVEFDD